MWPSSEELKIQFKIHVRIGYELFYNLMSNGSALKFSMAILISTMKAVTLLYFFFLFYFTRIVALKHFTYLLFQNAFSVLFYKQVIPAS